MRLTSEAALVELCKIDVFEATQSRITRHDSLTRTVRSYPARPMVCGRKISKSLPLVKTGHVIHVTVDLPQHIRLTARKQFLTFLGTATLFGQADVLVKENEILAEYTLIAILVIIVDGGPGHIEIQCAILGIFPICNSAILSSWLNPATIESNAVIAVS